MIQGSPTERSQAPAAEAQALDEFPRIQNGVRIQRLFESRVEGANFNRSGQRPPRFFRQPDAMLAGDNAAQRDHFREKIVQRGIASARVIGKRLIHHEVDVDVAVARMAETRDGETVPLLQRLGERKKLFEAAARHNDVLVQFGQPRVPQRVGKFAPKLPDLFALFRAERALDKAHLRGENERLQLL